MRVDVPVAVVSADFRVASTLWRSRLALDLGERASLYRELQGQGVTGFVQVATCNRTEWIAVGGSPAWTGELLRAEAFERWRGHGADRPPQPTLRTGEDAVRHVLRVAIGLESFARGERQIAGQVHRAFGIAREEGTACGVVNVLETVVGRTVARASALHGFRTHKAGVHREVSRLLASRLPTERRRVVVVGMGTIGRATAGALAEHGFRVTCANRTVAEDSDWLRLDDLAGADADAMVVATGAQVPVVTARHLPNTGLVVVDVGSPAQVDPALADRVELVDLDGLLGGHAGEASEDGVRAAHAEVESGLEELRRALGKRELRHIVHDSRHRYEQIAWTELPALLEAHGLAAGQPGRAALEGAIRSLFRDYAHTILDAVERQTQEEGP